MTIDVVDMLALQPLPLFDKLSVSDGVSDSDSLPLSQEYSSCSPSSSAPSTSASSSSSLAGSPISSPDVAIGLAQPEPDFFSLDQTTITQSRRHGKQRKVVQTSPRYAQYAADLVKREAKALLELAQRLEGQTADEQEYQPDSRQSMESFDRAVDILNTMHKYGKVVITGIGKSGLLARKAVATFNSLGIQSAFLHPSEALHGDLGLVSPHGLDVVILVSYSGKTRELLDLTHLLRRKRCHALIAITKPDSPLAELSDVTLDASVEEDVEADHTVPAPTSSVMVALSLLDSLALTLLRLRTGWEHEDGQKRKEVFATNHPGGNLGQVLGSAIV